MADNKPSNDNQVETGKTSPLELAGQQEIVSIVQQAQTMINQMNIEDAVRFLQEKERTHPGSAIILDMIQRLSYDLKDYEGAIKYGEKMLEMKNINWDQTSIIYKAMLHLNEDGKQRSIHLEGPDPNLLYRKTALDLASEGFKKGAFESLEKIADKESLVYKKLKLGVLVNLYENVEAEKMGKNLMKENPNDHEIQKAIGFAYIHMRKYRKSIRLLEKAIEVRDEDSDRVMSHLISSLFKTKKYKRLWEVGEEYLQSIQKNGATDDALDGLNIMAYLHLKNKRYDDALRLFAMRLQVNKNDEYALKRVMEALSEKKDWKSYVAVGHHLLQVLPPEKAGGVVVDVAAGHWKMKNYYQAFSLLEDLNAFMRTRRSIEKGKEAMNELTEMVTETKWIQAFTMPSFAIFKYLVRKIGGKDQYYLPFERYVEKHMGHEKVSDFKNEFRRNYQFMDVNADRPETELKETLNLYGMLIKSLFSKKKTLTILKNEHAFKKRFGKMDNLDVFMCYAMKCQLTSDAESFWEQHVKQMLDSVDKNETTVNLVNNPEHQEEIKSTWKPLEEEQKSLEQLIIYKRSKEGDAHGRRRLEQEAERYEILNDIIPQNSPRVLLSKSFNGRHYLTMRMIKGECLSELIGVSDKEKMKEDIKKAMELAIKMDMEGTYRLLKPETERSRRLIASVKPTVIDYAREADEKFIKRMRFEEGRAPEQSLKRFSEAYETINQYLASKSIFLIHGDLHMKNVIKNPFGEIFFIDPAKMTKGTAGYEIMPLMFDSRLLKAGFTGDDLVELMEFPLGKLVSGFQLEIKKEDGKILRLDSDQFYRVLGVNPALRNEGSLVNLELTLSYMHRNIYCVGLFTKLYEMAKDPTQKAYFASAADFHYAMTDLNINLARTLLPYTSRYLPALNRLQSSMKEIVLRSQIPKMFNK